MGVALQGQAGSDRAGELLEIAKALTKNCFQDGPVGDIREVEVQLVDPPRARTTWILDHEGRIYIPCGYMTTTWGRVWKRWPIEALKDGRAILRIGGKLYERNLVRIEEGSLVAPLTAELSRKYAAGAAIGSEAVTSGYLWLFELAPRT